MNAHAFSACFDQMADCEPQLIGPSPAIFAFGDRLQPELYSSLSSLQQMITIKLQNAFKHDLLSAVVSKCTDK